MARPAGHRLNQNAWHDCVATKGYTPTSLAETSGVPRSTISALLGGHNMASVETAYRLASAADVRVATLFPSMAPGFATVPVADEAAS